MHHFTIITMVMAFMFGGPMGLVHNAEAQDSLPKSIKIVAPHSFPPYSMVDIDGKLVGFLPDLVDAFCKQAKMKCSLSAMEWTNLLAASRSNRVDLSLLLANDSRRKLSAFSSTIFSLSSVAVVRQDSLLIAADKQELEGLQIGARKSSPHAEYVRVHFPNSRLVELEDVNAVFEELSNGNIDVGFENSEMARSFISDETEDSCCRILQVLPVDQAINGEGWAFSIAPKIEPHRNALEAAIKKFLNSKQYQLLLDQYFPQNPS